MNIFEFLGRMENTLSEISVRGKADIQAMHACLQAIEDYRAFLLAQQNDSKADKEVRDDGRQSDIGTDSSNIGNGE